MLKAEAGLDGLKGPKLKKAIMTYVAEKHGDGDADVGLRMMGCELGDIIKSL